MDMGGRINACRMRLRHARAMQRAVTSNTAEPQALASVPLNRSGEGEGLAQEAATISIEEQSHVDWVEDGAIVGS
jgi:hypothetical protein